MATKLKNILLKKKTKAIAFLLAMLLFAGSGYFASMFIKGFYAYNSFGANNFTQSVVFRDTLNQFERTLLWSAEAISCSNVEDFKKTSDAKWRVEGYNERVKNVNEAYDFLDNSGIKIHISNEDYYRYSVDYEGKTYYFRYSGEVISKSEFEQYEYVRTFQMPLNPEMQNKQDFIGEISNAISSIGGASYNYYYSYGEKPRSELLEIIKAEYDESVKTAYSNAKSGSSRLGEYSSVNYAVYVPSTGKVVTNCGVTATDTQEQIVEKLGGEFVEGKNAGKYVLLKGKPFPEVGGDIYNEFFEWLIGSSEYPSVIKTTTSYKDGWIYVSYSPDNSGEPDALTVSNRLFDKHSQKNITSLNTCFVLFCVLFLLACAVCISLYCVAGKDENGEVKISKYDKIPFVFQTFGGLLLLEVFAFGVVGIVLCESMLPTEFGDSGFMVAITDIIGKSSSQLTGLFVAGFFAIITANIMSIIRNVRNKTFRKHSLIGRIFGFFGKRLKKAKEKIKNNARNLLGKGESKKFRLICAGITAAALAIDALVISIFFNAIYSNAHFIANIAFIFGVALIAVEIFMVLKIAAWYERIAQAVSDIRDGRIQTEIDTEGMPLIMKQFAEDIDCMRDGLNEAVESAVKDQRMKTELITNVSHDLKTPLTSIVNYVDLLKRCEIEDEEAQKYISILDEKSQRMKKLIEDLVEASKASSGAIELHPIKINLCEFAAQTVGEYEDELKGYGIDIVLKTPETPVVVTADSQKTSRIVENLFSNIKKYALEGTRVYAEVADGQKTAKLTFKNVSKYPLDISPDELVQRFVRGDASRSGEGSGLGLSIAKNLCELQRGELSIEIDGDLFKATVELPKK